MLSAVAGSSDLLREEIANGQNINAKKSEEGIVFSAFEILYPYASVASAGCGCSFGDSLDCDLLSVFSRIPSEYPGEYARQCGQCRNHADAEAA